MSWIRRCWLWVFQICYEADTPSQTAGACVNLFEEYEMKTLIFDMDDTLVVEEYSAEATFRKVCQHAKQKVGIDPEELYDNIRKSCRSIWYGSPAHQFCLNVGISSWEGLWAEFKGSDRNLRTLSDWAPTYRRESWRQAMLSCGYPAGDELATELADMFVQERRKLHIVYDDVVPVLNELKDRYILGLLTNGAPDLQRRKLTGAGLTDYFDEVIISGEVGFGKPDPRIFELMLNRLGSAAGSSAMIGNSLKSDIAPAIEIGMVAIWVNRDHRTVEGTITPKLVISDLSELTKVLEADCF